MPEAPVVIHQSDLQAYNRCPQELHLARKHGRGDQNSRSAYGSVMHHAITVLVRYDDLEKAMATFEHYWHPYNIEALCEPVPHDGWLARDSWGGMRKRGLSTLRNLHESLRDDDAERLALEYSFVVPLRGTPYYFAGTIDSLVARYRKRVLELHIEDYKTGKQKWGLRWNVQGTAYAYASLQPAFWLGHEPIELRRFGTDEVVTYGGEGFGNRGREVALRFDDVPRRFMWIDTKNGRWKDGGYRDHQDFARLRLAVEQLVALEAADVWPLRLDGETCQYCSMRKICGGVPVPDESHGDPWAGQDPRT